MSDTNLAIGLAGPDRCERHGFASWREHETRRRQRHLTEPQGFPTLTVGEGI